MTLVPVHTSRCPGENVFIVMKNFENSTIWKNNGCRLYHLGDDVLGLGVVHENGHHWW